MKTGDLKLPALALAVGLAVGMISPVRPFAAAASLPSITLQPGEQITIIAASAAPSPSVAVSPSASPSGAPSAAPSGSPSLAPPTASPSAAPPSPSPTPTPTPAPCPTNLQAAVDAAPAGSTLNVTGCSFTFRGNRLAVRKPLTLIGGTIRQTKADGSNLTDSFNPAVEVDADDVTFDGISILDGGAGISVYGGYDRTRVLHGTFSGISGGALMLWGGAAGGEQGTDDVAFEGNRVTQTEGCQAGTVGGRSSEDGSVHSFRIRVANNVMDQGGRSPTSGGCPAGAGFGWFGIELLFFDDGLIVGNDLRGGHALISLPRSNRNTISGNTLRLGPFTGTDPAKWGAYWGAEIATSNDTLIDGNTCIGPKDGYCFDHNSGSARSTITNNRAVDVRTLVEFYAPIGAGMKISDNCLLGGSTATFVQGGGPLPPDAVVARNGPLEGPCRP